MEEVKDDEKKRKEWIRKRIMKETKKQKRREIREKVKKKRNKKRGRQGRGGRRGDEGGRGQCLLLLQEDKGRLVAFERIQSGDCLSL